MLSKVPGGYLDVRTKGRAPGFGGHGEIVAGTQASRQKALANSRLAVPALHMLIVLPKPVRHPPPCPQTPEESSISTQIDFVLSL